MFSMRGLAPALVALGIATVSATTAGAETTLRFNQNLPANHWSFARIFIPWMKEVEKATNGHVKIALTGASLGGFDRSMDIAGEGIADITFGNYGTLHNRFLLAKLTEVPYYGEADPLPISIAYWRTYEKHFADALEHEKAGTKLLALWTSGANHFYTTEKPIRGAEDLRGLKFFTSSDVVDKILRKFGASGVVAGTEQAYDLVSKGVVDGAMFANTGPRATRTEEFYKYQTLMPGSWWFTGFYIVMNKAKYDALPPEDQKALMSVSGEHLVRAAATVFSELDAADLAARKKAGKIEIIPVSPAFLAEMKTKTQFAEGEWVDAVAKMGKDGKAALATFRSEVEAAAKKK